MATKKAELQAMLMTGTYILQTNRAWFNENRADSTCVLCVEDSEDFLLIYQALADVQNPFEEKIHRDSFNP